MVTDFIPSSSYFVACGQHLGKCGTTNLRLFLRENWEEPRKNSRVMKPKGILASRQFDPLGKNQNLSVQHPLIRKTSGADEPSSNN